MFLTNLLLLLGIYYCRGYDNLSLNKAAEEHIIYTCTPATCYMYKASNAIDGDISTCTRTRVISPSGPDHVTWWRVELGSIVNIYSVRIQFKDFGVQYEKRQKGRFAGFSLYSSNTTKKEDWFLCFKNGPDLPPLDLTINCSKHGRYIVYYNERLPNIDYPDDYELNAYTQLCEVTVKGCRSPGRYGSNCSLQCPKNCQNQRCDIVNGSCLGCRPGWTGTFCNHKCPFGFFGQNCSEKCSFPCKSGCNHVTGNCNAGCKAGYHGVKCDKLCRFGRYGSNCSKDCSLNCVNHSCDHETGACKYGCIPGWKDPKCSEECSPMTFGPKCKHICSGHCAKSHSCNHVTGICAKGCADGYNGSLCDLQCVEGYFGANCLRRCSQNCTNTCNHVSGICYCPPGFSSDPYCMEELKGEQTGETNSKAVTLIFSVVFNVLLLCFVVFLIRTIQIKKKTESRKAKQTVEPGSIENSREIHYHDLETVDQSLCYQELYTKDNRSLYQNYL